jgi:hypothetical protein
MKAITRLTGGGVLVALAAADLKMLIGVLILTLVAAAVTCWILSNATRTRRLIALITAIKTGNDQQKL